MITLKRTDSEDQDFILLVKSLDEYLAITDGEEHSFYNQYNSIDALRHVVVAYEKDRSTGCGAMKQYDTQTMEIKRMYTLPEIRGKGIATQILMELENWTREMSLSRCLLETGKRQTEAIALYKKHGYEVIPNYGQYLGMKNSVCFEKRL